MNRNITFAGTIASRGTALRADLRLYDKKRRPSILNLTFSLLQSNLYRHMKSLWKYTYANELLLFIVHISLVKAAVAHKCVLSAPGYLFKRSSIPITRINLYCCKYRVDNIHRNRLNRILSRVCDLSCPENDQKYDIIRYFTYPKYMLFHIYPVYSVLPIWLV